MRRRRRRGHGRSGGNDVLRRHRHDDKRDDLAATVENLGAAAYFGQAANIESPEILAAALSIHSVEARHASALNVLLGKSATPDEAFAQPASMEEVLEAVQPFIAS